MQPGRPRFLLTGDSDHLASEVDPDGPLGTQFVGHERRRARSTGDIEYDVARTNRYCVAEGSGRGQEVGKDVPPVLSRDSAPGIPETLGRAGHP
jgi:hypothetical protein